MHPENLQKRRVAMKKLLYFLLIALLIFTVSCSGDNSNPGVDPGLDDNGTPVIDDPNSGNSQEATASVVSGLTKVISTIMEEVSSEKFQAPDSFAVDDMSAKVEFLDGDTLRLSVVPSVKMESDWPVIETTYTLGDVSGLALTHLAGASEVREIVYETNGYKGYAYQVDGGDIITEEDLVYAPINSEISLITSRCNTCRVNGTAKVSITGLTVGGEKQNVTAAANVDGSLTVDEFTTEGVPSVVTVSGGAAVSADLSGSIAGISDVTIRLNLDDALSFSIPQGEDGPAADEVKAMVTDIIRKLPNIGIVITEGELAGNWYLTPKTIEDFATTIMP